jgi:hypothetical protein
MTIPNARRLFFAPSPRGENANRRLRRVGGNGAGCPGWGGGLPRHNFLFVRPLQRRVQPDSILGLAPSKFARYM